MFEHPLDAVGNLKVHSVDPHSQNMRVELRIPAFTLFALLPLLGKHCIINHIEIDPSKNIFIPDFNQSDFNLILDGTQLSILKSTINSKSKEYMDTVNELRTLLSDSVKSLPYIPMGVMVNVDMGVQLSDTMECIRDLSDLGSPVSILIADAWVEVTKRMCHAYRWTFSDFAQLGPSV